MLLWGVPVRVSLLRTPSTAVRVRRHLHRTIHVTLFRVSTRRAGTIRERSLSMSDEGFGTPYHRLTDPNSKSSAICACGDWDQHQGQDTSVSMIPYLAA